jgi:hypothetical protein
MIERLLFPKFILNPPNPSFGVNERAYLECGCQVFVGRRLDNYEVATMAASCSPTHDQLVNHFQMLLAESTVDPSDEPLVDVCERLLEQAEQYS